MLIRRLVITAIAAITAGCSSTHSLMPTPSSWQKIQSDLPFRDTPAARRKPPIDLLYITDRQPQTDSQEGLPYGEGRSYSLAFGAAAVEMGPDLSWLELERQSRLAQRTRGVNLNLGETKELGRFPPIPYQLQTTPSGIVRTAQVMDDHRKTRTRFETELRRRLEQSPSKDVVLYVHGFNETFASAAYTSAELCHFFGRRDVCAFFTWPASSTGFLLRSFTTTTESAKFSVGNLKRTIRMIAQTPGVDRLHLLAHSRGSAVLLDATRELVIEAVAAGIEPARAFRIENLIVLAPDVDADVARTSIGPFISDPDQMTRWTPKELPRMVQGRITIYTSPEDRALILSTRLFRSRTRVGNLSAGDLAARSAEHLATRGNVDFVVVKGRRTDFFGHFYFLSNPEVSSDLIQLVRFGTKPGEPGRPLRRLGPVSWAVPDG